LNDGTILVKISQLILMKIIKNVASRYQILRLKAPNSVSAGALPLTLPGTFYSDPSWI